MRPIPDQCPENVICHIEMLTYLYTRRSDMIGAFTQGNEDLHGISSRQPMRASKPDCDDRGKVSHKNDGGRTPLLVEQQARDQRDSLHLQIT